MRFIAMLVVLILLLPATIRSGAADSIPRVELIRMHREADLVAYIRIRSGSLLGDGGALYIAEVVRPFKGTSKGDLIEVGFYTSYAIGTEYLAFLEKIEPTYGGRYSINSRTNCLSLNTSDSTAF